MHTKRLYKAFAITIATFLIWNSGARSAELPSKPGEAAHSRVPNVIFDTDMWADIDDMLALAMLHALHDRHEINLVAVTIGTEHKWSASYVDLVNTFYGHAGIPIGIVHNGVSTETIRNKNLPSTWPTSYTKLLSERRNGNGTPVYPNRLRSGESASEAVSLLRKTLAAQPNGSVLVIQVGYSTNLARLLESGADASSPLSGGALVAKKVTLLSLMAGGFRDVQVDGKAPYKGSSEPEFNLAVDVPAAQHVY